MKALIKYPSLVLIILITTLLQYSFLPHFSIMGIVPNILFILFFLFLFFGENTSHFDVILTTFTIGFFMDIFSPHYFGAKTLFLLILLFLLKTIMHFVQERQEKYFLIYFITLFLVAFTLYSAILEFTTLKSLLIALVYNTSLVTISFFIYHFFHNQNSRQLKLFT